MPPSRGGQELVRAQVQVRVQLPDLDLDPDPDLDQDRGRPPSVPPGSTSTTTIIHSSLGPLSPSLTSATWSWNGT